MIIASASTKDTFVNRWDLDSHIGQQKIKLPLSGNKQGVEVLHGTEIQGSRYLFSGSIDSSICCWLVADGDRDHNESLFTLQGHAQTVRSLTSIKNSSVLVSGSWDCTIRLWDLSSLQSSTPVCFKVLESEHVVSGSNCFISLDNDPRNQNQFYSLSLKGLLQQWSTEWDKPIAEANVNLESAGPSYIQALHSLASSELVATSFNSPNAYLWDIGRSPTKPVIELVNGGNKGILSSIASLDYQLFTGSQDGMLLAWDIRQQTQPIAVQQAHNGTCASINTFGGELVVSGGSDNTIRVWKSGSGLLELQQELKDCQAGTKGVWTLHCMPPPTTH